MKRLFLISLLYLLLTSCSSDKNFKIGITPNGIPITLNINSSGFPTIDFAGSIKLPFLTLSISTDNYIQPYCTYVELYNRKENRKHVFELAKNNTSIKIDTDGKTEISVIKKKYSTVVIINSEEISNYLYKGPEPKAKPDFPEHPWQYFAVAKAFNSNIDWNIDSVSDFFADILYGIIWILAVLIDLIIIIISFAIRLIIWIFILLAYAFGIT
jgi:hypothetical protein